MSKSRLVYAIAAAALLIGPPGCGGEKKGAPPPAKPNITTTRKDLPNIIVLTVDTLRADHLARYGYSRDTMPAIEKFADTAVVFDDAVVPRGSTRPSYASMLTGLYPFHHGVRSNAVSLHEDLVTLPEMLKAVGYHTAAFVSNFVLIGEMSGCDQGFDVYDDRLEEREANRVNYERTAPRTLKAILEWLESDPPQPFFLFTNFIDPHGPYEPPERYREMYRSSERRTLRLEQIPPYQRKAGVLDFYDYVDRYDAEIRYTDEALGILIAELKKKGWWDDALIVFTADHGESLGEHGVFFEHDLHVWEETTRVPLAIRLPIRTGGANAPPRRVGGVCSPMDLPPTVVSLLEISGGPAFDGRDLLPILRGGPADLNRMLLVEFPHAMTRTASAAAAYAVRTAGYKMMRVLDTSTGKVQGQACFDLTADPNELAPIAYDPENETHRRLAARLDALIDEVESYETPFVPTEYELPVDQRPGFIASRKDMRKRNFKTLTPDQIERLRSLGYVE